MAFSLFEEFIEEPRRFSERSGKQRTEKLSLASPSHSCMTKGGGSQLGRAAMLSSHLGSGGSEALCKSVLDILVGGWGDAGGGIGDVGAIHD